MATFDEQVQAFADRMRGELPPQMLNRSPPVQYPQTYGPLEPPLKPVVAPQDINSMVLDSFLRPLLEQRAEQEASRPQSKFLKDEAARAAPQPQKAPGELIRPATTTPAMPAAPAAAGYPTARKVGDFLSDFGVAAGTTPRNEGVLGSLIRGMGAGNQALARGRAGEAKAQADRQDMELKITRLMLQAQRNQISDMRAQMTDERGRRRLDQMDESLKARLDDLDSREKDRDRRFDALEKDRKAKRNLAERKEKRLATEKKGGGKLTKAQERTNAEIDRARADAQASDLAGPEFVASTESASATGRINRQYDKNNVSIYNTARRRKFGEDPDYDTFQSWLSGKQAEPAPATPEAAVNPDATDVFGRPPPSRQEQTAPVPTGPVPDMSAVGEAFNAGDPNTAATRLREMVAQGAMSRARAGAIMRMMQQQKMLGQAYGS